MDTPETPIPESVAPGSPEIPSPDLVICGGASLSLRSGKSGCKLKLATGAGPACPLLVMEQGERFARPVKDASVDLWLQPGRPADLPEDAEYLPELRRFAKAASHVAEAWTCVVAADNGQPARFLYEAEFEFPRHDLDLAAWALDLAAMLIDKAHHGWVVAPLQMALPLERLRSPDWPANWSHDLACLYLCEIEPSKAGLLAVIRDELRMARELKALRDAHAPAATQGGLGL